STKVRNPRKAFCLLGATSSLTSLCGERSAVRCASVCRPFFHCLLSCFRVRKGSPMLDESLIPRLPLPLAQLYRRAHNEKSALARYLTAYYLWEASLKLLAATSIITYAGRAERSTELTEQLQNLARPALGHWWSIVRGLVPFL